MKTSYDVQTDSLFVRFTEGDIKESEEVSPDFVLDFDQEGHIVACEILNASERLGHRFMPSDLTAA